MWLVQSHTSKSARAVDAGGGQGDGGSLTVLVFVSLDTMSRSWFALEPASWQCRSLAVMATNTSGLSPVA